MVCSTHYNGENRGSASEDVVLPELVVGGTDGRLGVGAFGVAFEAALGAALGPEEMEGGKTAALVLGILAEGGKLAGGNAGGARMGRDARDVSGAVVVVGIVVRVVVGLGVAVDDH